MFGLEHVASQNQRPDLSAQELVLLKQSRDSSFSGILSDAARQDPASSTPASKSWQFLQ